MTVRISLFSGCRRCLLNLMSRPVSFLKSSSERLFKPQRRCTSLIECRRRASREEDARGKESFVVCCHEKERKVLNCLLVFTARRYSAATTATASSSQQKRQEKPEAEYLDDEEAGDSFPDRGHWDRTAPSLYPRPKPRADPWPLVEHLKRLFPPLEFPDTVATQMLTHISAKEAWAGHNARLAFVGERTELSFFIEFNADRSIPFYDCPPNIFGSGRRVLHSYLLLFLQHASRKLTKTTSPSVDPDSAFNFDLIAYRTLHTHKLGEHVGAQWDLARIMLWTLPVNRGKVQESLKSPGLYKVQGTTVEGIMGGIFHQFVCGF